VLNRIRDTFAGLEDQIEGVGRTVER
jgi:hypothetical protein